MGYQIVKLHKYPLDNIDPFYAVSSLMDEQNRAGIFFDVGANTGQTILELRKYFPIGKIFAFEPGSAFAELYRNYYEHSNVSLENLALGARDEVKVLYENSHCGMSSFLTLGEKGWGEITNESQVTVTTIDSYCKEKGISRINLLKCDTQGFELEILKGARESLKNIQYVFLEINFSEIYKGLPSFFDIYGFLSSYNFRLVKFYRQLFADNLLLSTDALFYNLDFEPKVKSCRT